MNLRILSVIS